jgi:hypothetical protein
MTERGTDLVSTIGVAVNARIFKEALCKFSRVGCFGRMESSVCR